MRPVVRPPNPAQYCTVRVDTRTHLRNDLGLITLAKPSQVIRSGLGIDKPTQVTMWNVVNGLLTLAKQPRPLKRKKGDPPPPPLTPLQSARGSLDSQVEIYREANPYLKTDLGLFCSYCEQVLSEMIAVEHVVPKAPFPFTSVSWQNFLLCCRACNSKKGDTPARVELAGWNLNPAPTYELERYAAIRAHYLWPDDGDHTVNSQYAYTGLVPALFFNAGNGWEEMDAQQAVADGVVVVNKGTALNKTVHASIPIPNGTPWQGPVLVKLVPAGPAAVAAQRTLDELTDMNFEGAGKNDDNRAWHRTLRWLAAAEAFTDLKQGWSSRLFKAICNEAAAGFLTTWVRVLELRGGAAVKYPADKSQTLLQAFIATMTQQTTQPYGPYPGTNIANLP